MKRNMNRQQQQQRRMDCIDRWMDKMNKINRIFELRMNVEWDSSTAHGQVYSVTDDGDLPLAGMNTNACDYTNCPIQTSNRQAYAYTLPLAKKFPVVSDAHKMRRASFLWHSENVFNRWYMYRHRHRYKNASFFCSSSNLHSVLFFVFYDRVHIQSDGSYVIQKNQRQAQTDAASQLK